MRLGLTTHLHADALSRRLGGRARDARVAMGWGQREIAERVGVSQSRISRFENGEHESIDLELAIALSDELGSELILDFIPPQRPDGPRLRDPIHARCLAYDARRLPPFGWQVATEVEVGSGRWRSWIDLLGWHEMRRALLIQEIKTEIHDAGGEQRRLARYERDVEAVCRAQGWQPRTVSSGLVLLATERNDERLRELRDWARAFPVRATEWVTWIRSPDEPLPGRGLAMIDPTSKRANWLRPTQLDGRRTRAPFRDYADFMERARLARGRR